mgnify:CR=1 FL=1
MKYIVGMADMKVASGRESELVTYALGSCLGITVFDSEANVGGLLHVMLPSSNINNAKADDNLLMFVDTGVPKLFNACYKAGAHRDRLVIKVAGGAAVNGNSDFFSIGQRNYTMLKKLFWKNGIIIKAEDVGGTISRTMTFNLDSGQVLLKNAGKEWVLE